MFFPNASGRASFIKIGVVAAIIQGMNNETVK
jgi:hypothetical protein